MSEPWFEPNTFGMLFGAIGGGVGGSLCGILGAAAGVLAPRGRGRAWILGGFYLSVALGLLSLGFGIAAVLNHQPYGIWYPALLMGIVLTAVMGGLIPVVRLRYAQAEARRLEADGIRNA